MSRSVLVIGGASNDSIGAAICVRLQDLGHFAFAPSQDEIDVLRDEDASVLLEMINECKPDSIVYAAGINELEWSAWLVRESFEHIIGVNVWGFINVLKTLQATGRAYSVLALTSDAAYRPMRTSIAYCASKAALDMAIRVASRELAAEGWRINGLAPGKVDGTAMTRYVDERVPPLRGWTREEAERYELSSSPIKRKVTREEIAAVACDILLSPVMAWTGDIVTVNGGR